MRYLMIIASLLLLSACSTSYPNQAITGQAFPSVSGQNLEEKSMTLPDDLKGEVALLLIGYKQDSQFDIDRWLIGLDMTQTQVSVFEVPTIQGLFPRMFSTFIDNGMRSGIPKPLWKGVVTVYKDGEKVQAFTGNEKPNNTRVVLLNAQGKVIYFYDQGFSVDALNQLRAML
ncbi:MAG: hypothetical protein V7771_08480 [Shewanella psychromarinicola]|jgi:hypothetical protein|uniref:Lipoprotein n=1 Tax=Shewanella psychromarinicola TaxID=2487742 RepID=A0A3N4E5L0_9GAMM|nr:MULTISPECIES: hypothetical protein [Shewanella]AZG34686.1 hypothetical protein EGC80_06970 [Shewanella psychromarinicola]MCL1083042.1 hypothetical protein [Shewanella psychromarinicola]PKG79660.1 hypothetical protein CXF80_15865 [Shewanella sp. Actino-trap-3]RPA33525.1 hypothetical protein EGC77_09395 [Shewanella psychromarinicola]|tara:strand:- start:156429 stop:156944 length:516 start_codon:yes stop_codon:yes gene_type:complete